MTNRFIPRTRGFYDDWIKWSKPLVEYASMWRDGAAIPGFVQHMKDKPQYVQRHGDTEECHNAIFDIQDLAQILTEAVERRSAPTDEEWGILIADAEKGRSALQEKNFEIGM